MKYKLTDETKERAGITLHRIECVEPFGGIKVGDKGGWIEKEENLSQDGDAWIFGNAMVFGGAEVYGDAILYGNAEVSGNAKVYGDARVYGNAKVSGNAILYGDARVYGNANISKSITNSMRIRSTAEFYEYQSVMAELQAKWDKNYDK